MDWITDKRILDFATTNDGKLVMDWSDGTRRVFDTRPTAKNSLRALLDPEYFAKAYLQGQGYAIAWPDGQDYALDWLYEDSEVVDSSKPLPPRSPIMTWTEEVTIMQCRHTEGGKLLIDWSDGTRRAFDVWWLADDDAIEKFVDPAYLAQARIAPDRDAVIWPDGERFDAKTLYERSAVVEG